MRAWEGHSHRRNRNGDGSVKEEKGTAIWLDKVPGGPPLRFVPLSGGGQRRYTKREKSALVNYVVEQRGVKFLGQCSGESGVGIACISSWMKKECKTYRAFSKLSLDANTIRAIDFRELLADLRAGKDPIRTADHAGWEKYRNSRKG